MYNSTVVFLDEAAKFFGDKTAIIDGETQITYNEYRDLAMSVASCLLSEFSSFKKSRAIAVFLPKSYKCLVSFMGIMYSGNIYIPIDTGMPAKRLEKIFANLCPDKIITDPSLIKKLKSVGIEDDKILYFDKLSETPHNKPAIDRAINKVIDSDPMYIMYTSGSTGDPKGVVIPHRGVVDFANWLTETFQFGPDMILGNQSPFHFDNTVLDIYSCLKNGGTIVIIPEVFFKLQTNVLDYLNETRINTIFWVPTIYINLANSGVLEDIKLPYLKRALFAGEIMPNKALNAWRKAYPQVLYANLYGLTEITDICTYYIVDREFADHDPLPIGIACENMEMVIMGDNGKEVEKGQVGELCVIGSGLALGYYRDKTLTERFFKQNPLNDRYMETIYFTGDLGYEAPDGLIMFCGRKDSQIKHRGNRIEPGEIEAAAMSQKDVGNACAMYDSEKSQIVLFLEMDTEPDMKAIKSGLINLLPNYMVPARIQRLEKFPYTTNLKIDRIKLKELI